MTDYPSAIRHHPVAQLLIWAGQGNRVKTADMDEAEIPAGLRADLLAAIPEVQALWKSGAQQDARNKAAEVAAVLSARYPSTHGRAHDPLPDDPRALADLVQRRQ